MCPVIGPPVKVVGQYKGRRYGYEYQGVGIETFDKDIKQDPTQEHVKQHLVNVLNERFPGLESFDHIQACDEYQEHEIAVKEITRKMS